MNYVKIKAKAHNLALNFSLVFQYKRHFYKLINHSLK